MSVIYRKLRSTNKNVIVCIILKNIFDRGFNKCALELNHPNVCLQTRIYPFILFTVKILRAIRFIIWQQNWNCNIFWSWHIWAFYAMRWYSTTSKDARRTFWNIAAINVAIETFLIKNCNNWTRNWWLPWAHVKRGLIFSH